GFVIGTAGPWPLTPFTSWGVAAGLDEPIIDVQTDEAQNVWAVSHQALYLLRPGETRFRKYTGADGLSLHNAEPPGITAVGGGAADEVWVGYEGAHVEDTQRDPNRFRGKLDRVRLNADGTLSVKFYNVHNNDVVGFDENGDVIRLPDGSVDPQYTDWSFNENRSVKRFLYDHFYNRGSLYVGFNHGVTRIDADRIDPIHGFDFADHVHPVVRDARGTQRMGDWRALALDPTERVHKKTGEARKGTIWMGGKWTAGASNWTPGLYEWTRNELNPFWKAFMSPPVFPLPDGEPVHIYGIAAMATGSVYVAGGPGSSGFTPQGIAHWKDRQPWTYIAPEDIGLPSREIIDLQRLPDDTLLVLLRNRGLWHWDPAPFPNGTLKGQLDVKTTRIHRIYVDHMVSPAAVYAATPDGVAVLRM
ncbi:MAG: hypothetical protein ACK4N5_02700, partial [Myxococcales bacterium]